MNKIVKLVTRGSIEGHKSGYINHCFQPEQTFGTSKFTFEPFEQKYDWLVVIDDIPKILKNNCEILKCPRENTILVTMEPSSIAHYGKAFAKQFAHLITNQNDQELPHPNAQRSQTGNVWFYGKTLKEILKTTEPKKSKKISTVCSDKQQGHTIHKLRYDFTGQMEDKISQLERFGHGIKWINTKAEALDEYEFHVAIENQYAPDVWTEKLADTFLGFCVPIYYGCPNIFDYFPQESIILIDIYDFEGSISKIKKIINTPGEYERRLPAIKEARRRVIEDYNLLAMINNFIEKAPKSQLTPNSKIYSRKVMRIKYLPDLIDHIVFKTKNICKEIQSKLAKKL